MVESQEGQCDKSREEFEKEFPDKNHTEITRYWAWRGWQASRSALDKAVMWLYGHCRAIGMTEFSDSKLPEDDIALFTIRLKERAEAAAKALRDEVRKKADVQSENEKLREVLSTVKTYGHLLPSLIRDDVEQALSPNPAQCPHCGVPLTGMNSNPDECLRRPSDAVPTSTCIGTPVVTVSKGAPAGVAAPPWAQDIIKADTLLGVYSGGDVSSVYVNWFRWQRLADWLNEEWRNGGRSDVQG